MLQHHLLKAPHVIDSANFETMEGVTGLVASPAPQAHQLPVSSPCAPTLHGRPRSVPVDPDSTFPLATFLLATFEALDGRILHGGRRGTSSRE